MNYKAIHKQLVLCSRKIARKSASAYRVGGDKRILRKYKWALNDMYWLLWKKTKKWKK